MKEENQLQAYNIRVTAFSNNNTTKLKTTRREKKPERKVSKQLNKQVNVPEITHAKYG